jgi:hypothetical protein
MVISGATATHVAAIGARTGTARSR